MLRDKTVYGVVAHNSGEDCDIELQARTVICNMEPKSAANMIGLHHFSRSVRKKLAYNYSSSNFMIYCTLEGIDLAAHGFGNWNTFHSGHQDINRAFEQMYYQYDYSNPSFAITICTRSCPVIASDQDLLKIFG